MHINIHGRNLQISESNTNYVEKRLQKLARHVPNVDEVNVELMVDKTRSLSDSFGCEITFWLDTRLLRAEATSADLCRSVSLAVEKTMRQLEKVKARHRHKGRASIATNTMERIFEEIENGEYAEATKLGEIVRTKEFYVQVMSAEDAIEQMEMLGHDFFLFGDANTHGINLVYKRRDDQYGLLKPEINFAL